MRFIISDTFQKALTKLTPVEQSLTKQSAFDFQMNPGSPGFNFERLERPKDPNFRSCRINQDLRIILHQLGESLMLCYVDHHEAAYQWAERRKVEVHPKTGAAQVVEVVEREEIRTIIRQVAQDPPLFARYDHSYIEALGVPVEWVDAVRTINQNGLEALIGRLPDEALERLFDLAAGNPVPIPTTRVGVNPYLHPDAQRRFRILDSDEELRQALDYPWERWIVFLHPSQREIVQREFSGPAYVSGSAGTGKSVVAIHRASVLARRGDDSRILLTSFSKTLARRLNTSLDLLMGKDDTSRKRVSVGNVHQIAVSLWGRMGGTFSAATDRTIVDALESSKTATCAPDLSTAFLKSEWDSLIDPWGFSEWEEYKTASRMGRGVSLGARQKLRVWAVIERAQHRLLEAGFLTWNGLCHLVARKLKNKPDKPFTSIVIDECQDLGPAELALLRALTVPGHDDLFFCGDPAQRIFRGRFSWQRVGIEVRGRSSRLRINYRTTQSIQRLADSIQNNLEIVAADGEPRDALSLLTGPDPQVFAGNDIEREVLALTEWLKGVAREGVRPNEIAIFARTESLLRTRAMPALQNIALPVFWLKDDGDVGHGVTLGTMHRAKGLEFKAVAVIGCDADILPYRQTLESIQDAGDKESFIAHERNLLYVACSRAREHLLVSAAGLVSVFLTPTEVRAKHPC